MKKILFYVFFLFLLSCSIQKRINNRLIVNKWEYSESTRLQVKYQVFSLNSNNYMYHFLENGNVYLFHTDMSILEKDENLNFKCGNDFFRLAQSLPKIKLIGKWQFSNDQILKIQYKFKGKVFVRKMKINFLSKAYLDVELLTKN